MEENVLDIEGLHAQFTEWCGNNIHIEKKELHDIDHIHMNLDRFSYDKNARTIDGYEATYTLQLNGSGNIITNRTEQTLPDDVYEIPLEDSATFETLKNGLLLHTNRGTYKITIDSSIRH